HPRGDRPRRTQRLGPARQRHLSARRRVAAARPVPFSHPPGCDHARVLRARARPRGARGRPRHQRDARPADPRCPRHAAAHPPSPAHTTTPAPPAWARRPGPAPADNPLPQTARATVNCRILPDQDVAEVERTLARVIADGQVRIIPKGRAVLSPPSPINAEVMRAVESLAGEMWPGVPVIPIMGGGYTDSRWLRNAGIPAYGVAGLFTDPANSGTHGLNEQVGVKELYQSKAFLYRLVKMLAAPGQSAVR